MQSRLAVAALLTACTAFFAPPASADMPIQLVSSPALPPDGSQIAFSWRGDVWVVPVEGGRAKLLTTHEASDGQPAFSPDGKQIAFISHRTGSDQVFVMARDGGEPKQLTHHTGGYSLLEWYPNGESLLTQATRDHFWRKGDRFLEVSVVKPQSGERLLFDAYGADATISPDGKSVLFTREGTAWWRKGYRGSQASQVWLYSVPNKKFRQLVTHPTDCPSPLWDPSGQRFYYVSGQSGAFNLWRRELDSEHEVQLTEFSDDSVTFPTISRDGSVIVFRHLFDLYSLRLGDGFHFP